MAAVRQELHLSNLFRFPEPALCTIPEALDEIRGDLLGLSYAEDWDLMVAFGRAVLDGRDGTVRDALDAVGEDELRLALARLGTPTVEVAP